MLLVAAAAAYYFFFMKKKAPLIVTLPGMPSAPPTSQPTTMLQPQIQTESVMIVDQLQAFNESMAQQQAREGQYQNFYVNQVNGVKRMGVPYTV